MEFPGRRETWQTLSKLAAALVAAGVLAAGLALPYIGGLGLVAGREATKFQDTACHLQESKPPQRTTLYARDGKTVIATLFNQDRVPVPLSDVPQYLQDALISTEDRRFYHHHGVDIRGLIRSAISTSSGDTQGGSTLTMQYVKQIRYYQAGNDPKKQAAAIAQNINRKIEDAKCALYIEGTLHESKHAILDNYLNIAFFGENSYGIQTAAETYFDKPARNLTLDESATLVGLLRAPSAYDPFLHPEAARARRNEVLQNLVTVGKLSQQAANRQKALPIALATKSPPTVHEGCANSTSTIKNIGFFCEYAVHWLEDTDKITPTQLQTGGLKVITTLSPRLQQSAQEHVSKAVPASSPMTAVLPAVDPHTGDVVAMAASKTYGTHRGQTEQPVFTAHVANGASTYKLFPLLTALGLGVPKDWPLQTVGNIGTYKPKYCLTKGKVGNGDADESYSSQETLSTATAQSDNTYFVGLADYLLDCQLNPIVDLARKLGMKGFDEPSDMRGQNVGEAIETQQRAQQLVLGSVPTSPLELAGAYAAVANKGMYNAPAPILSVTNDNGNALPVRRSPGAQVVAPQTAAQAVDILTGDTQGSGTSAIPFQSWYSANSSQIAGKTGTNAAVKANGKESAKNASVWFVGMTPHLVATSALINFNYPTHPSVGLPHTHTGAAYGDYASGVWLRAFKSSLVGKHWAWQSADSVSGVEVPPLTGMEVGQARQELASYGLKMSVLSSADNLRCASSAPYDTIAFYGPHRATRGSTIMVCQSLGVAQPVYVPPVITKPSHGHGHSGSGNGHSGNGSGGNGTSGGTGNQGSGVVGGTSGGGGGGHHGPTH